MTAPASLRQRAGERTRHELERVLLRRREPAHALDLGAQVETFGLGERTPVELGTDVSGEREARAAAAGREARLEAALGVARQRQPDLVATGLIFPHPHGRPRRQGSPTLEALSVAIEGFGEAAHGPKITPRLGSRKSLLATNLAARSPAAPRNLARAICLECNFLV